ncbi:hypothetical protein CDAR_230661 [Caerostris darwini]|uniref:Uncharacterized protein n=1 Tax=Caerostris darwini TaxID=1538125 RepID=A0AAV4S5U4_9ARAC|nr:hypothetical protein CDAR_230661 [Caerostris darwini]
MNYSDQKARLGAKVKGEKKYVGENQTVTVKGSHYSQNQIIPVILDVTKMMRENAWQEIEFAIDKNTPLVELKDAIRRAVGGIEAGMLHGYNRHSDTHLTC